MTDTDGQSTTEYDETDDERPDDHLDSVEDGCGCAEVWEHLSEEREED
ncbi:hypothetical protein [Halorhabdus amylolytica]|nr:hypothetical protein [Halorhabdus amylolytica]